MAFNMRHQANVVFDEQKHAALNATFDETPPSDFLTSAAPNATAKGIDFSKTSLPCYKNCYAVIIDNVLSPDECLALIHYAEASAPQKWERALINVGGGRQMMMEDTRKCGRIIWDEQAMVDRIWERCRPLVPELEKIDSTNWPMVVDKKSRTTEGKWKMSRVNERMRILKYTGGEYFKPHYDGSYVTPDGKEKSFFTLHLYLNDADHQEDGERLRGGATTFWDYMLDNRRRLDVNPKMGSVLIFQHAELLHSGDDLLSGTKYTMRSDLMYAADEE